MVYGCNDIDSNSSLVGHGGSDGLHGYVPSLDHVVADTVSSAFCVCVHRATWALLSACSGVDHIII